MAALPHDIPQPTRTLGQIRDEVFEALPTLHGARVRLCPISLDDAGELDPIYAEAGPEHGPQHQGMDTTLAIIEGWLKRHQGKTGIGWTITLDGETRPCGTCSLHTITWANRRGEIGFTLATSHMRRGIMTEAAMSVLRFAFRELELIKVGAHATLGNLPCHAFLKRLGFQEEGLLRQHAYWDGQARDLRAFGLLAGEFPKAAFAAQ